MEYLLQLINNKSLIVTIRFFYIFLKDTHNSNGDFMKETGVSRRIDELGRIVIPKEIRKNLRIHEGDQMEFYVEKEYVVLKKQSSLNGLDEDIEHLLEVLYRKIKQNVILTDLDKILYSLNDKTYIGLELTKRFKSILSNRKIYDGYILDIVVNKSYNSDIYVLPLISNGDLYGSIIVFQNNDYLIDNEKEIISLIGEYIIKKLDY